MRQRFRRRFVSFFGGGRPLFSEPFHDATRARWRAGPSRSTTLRKRGGAPAQAVNGATRGRRGVDVRPASAALTFVPLRRRSAPFRSVTAAFGSVSQRHGGVRLRFAASRRRSAPSGGTARTAAFRRCAVVACPQNLPASLLRSWTVARSSKRSALEGTGPSKQARASVVEGAEFGVEAGVEAIVGRFVALGFRRLAGGARGAPALEHEDAGDAGAADDDQDREGDARE